MLSLLAGSCAWQRLSSCRAMRAPVHLPAVCHLKLCAVAWYVWPASLAQHLRTFRKSGLSSPCDDLRPYALAVDFPSQIASFDAASYVLLYSPLVTRRRQASLLESDIAVRRERRLPSSAPRGIEEPWREASRFMCAKSWLADDQRITYVSVPASNRASMISGLPFTSLRTDIPP